ncbi:hypothetical protein [Hyphomicrobium sp.]|uniref:hypothetical protein n=1 Tax=Hyphomicrobium sp. TaxID=82 RepID=UPI0025BEB536|nr:hypothetical protein [Hyphomicrobium sp.]MCC7251828.1 hypothetical protein [Hyphomicrobium sp.]
MTPKASIALLGSLLLVWTAGQGHAADAVFVAKLQPLNASKIGASASGNARLEVADGKLIVSIDLAGLPPGMHLQHFHGFPSGQDATCPTSEHDGNGDGYIDLIETEPVAGTTMVPFHAHPATLEIPSDSYPVADEHGAAHYEKTEVVADIESALKEKFKAPVLALEKRVIFVHGVESSTALPDSVKSLPGVPAHVTIPIACGKIEAEQ